MPSGGDSRTSSWQTLVDQWKQIQSDTRQRIRVEPLVEIPRYVAGADAAFSSDKTTVYAVAVVYDRIEQRIIDVAHHVADVNVPYIPGFLSFREGPAVLAAIRKLARPFGAITFDAHGYAHPRRCGLAAHLSVELNAIGIGIAKTRFIGTFTDPLPNAGSSSPLMDEGEQIGLVLRTRDNINPVFISIGHRIDLPSAQCLAMSCVTRYRLPEPTRQADIEVAKLKQQREG